MSCPAKEDQTGVLVMYRNVLCPNAVSLSTLSAVSRCSDVGPYEWDGGDCVV